MDGWRFGSEDKLYFSLISVNPSPETLGNTLPSSRDDSVLVVDPAIDSTVHLSAVFIDLYIVTCVYLDILSRFCLNHKMRQQNLDILSTLE